MFADKTSPSVDPEALIVEAAKGSRQAQSALIECAFEALLSDEATQRRACYVAEVFARLAAAHGGPDDRLKLAGILWVGAQVADNEGDRSEAERLAIESLVIMDGLADEGLDCVSALMCAEAANIPPHLLRLAAEQVRAERALNLAEET